MDRNHEIRKLVDEITRAFEELNIEKPSEILVKNIIFDAEAERVDRELKKMDWMKLARSPRPDRGQDIANLSEEALIYFLPGYMILCLQYPKEVDVLVDYILYALEPVKGVGPDRRAAFGKLRAALAQKQILVIVKFLEYYLGSTGWQDREALEVSIAYWTAAASLAEHS